MTKLEEQLIASGNALARSIGHTYSARCPKVSAAVPCTCGAAAQQAPAVTDWNRLVQSLKES